MTEEPRESPTWSTRRQSFGAVADTYDAHRPEWPAPTAAWLTGTEDGGPLAAVGEAPRPLRVLDLGAGTGKLTRTLVAAGHDVVAAEPSAGMRAVLTAALPAVPVLDAPAERVPLPDGSVDAVTAAQAWHWFDGPAAAAECARLLRPGGVLGVAWHIKDRSVPWVAELDALVGMPDDGADDRWTAPLRDAGAFRPVERREFEYRQRLHPEELVALAASWSYVAVRPDRDAVLAEVGALGRRVAGGGDGVLDLPHRTRCFRAVRH